MNANSFKAISLSYKKAPVEIRELISLNAEACKSLLKQVSEFTDAQDVLVLSTCNRTEIYYSSNQDLSEELIKLIGLQKSIPNFSQYIPYFNIINDGDNAVKHLFEVAVGLDAQVVGDMQIGNQVKHAYQWSADAHLAGPFLHRLLHTIFFTSKRISQETCFRDGAASVSYATVELIEELTTGLIEPKILILGLGEMGADVCRNLLNTNLKNIFIANRTQSKADELALECNYNAIPFAEVNDYILNCDVIVSSIANEIPFITKELIASKEILSYKFFIDMSIPRSIAPSVEDLPGAILYNVDNIKSKTTETQQKRLDAIPQVKRIVEESISEFNNWKKEMEVSPTIQKLKNALEQIRKDEITRHLKDLSEKESEAVDLITKNIMQKIIKLPVLQLKAACKRGEAETLIDVLNDLFDLEKQTELK